MLRLPHTGGPRAPNVFLKLLTRVDPAAVCGFGWDGSIHKPGAELPDAVAWPDGVLRDLVALECAGAPGTTGHRQAPTLYVLWLYCAKTGRWTEMARAQSTSWHWSLDLRPIAVRLLGAIREPDTRVMPSIDRVGERIGRYLDGQLQALEPRDRLAVLGVLHDAFAARIAASSAAALGGG